MASAAVIFAFLVLLAIGFILYLLNSYVQETYSFSIFGFGAGSLSLIPPALASIGILTTSNKEGGYWNLLWRGDLDILIPLGIALIAFIWIFILIRNVTDSMVALLTMLIAPPSLFLLFLTTAYGVGIAFAMLKTPLGWVFLLVYWLSSSGESKV
jgi:hypothetical protein